MSACQVKQLIPAQALREGAGVTVHRTIGTPSLRHFDPFLMLDHFGSNDPNQYIAGFPDHPHRGFITLTYMLDGHMLHQDSMGNRGDLTAGGAQWMKAASGVIHSEMPQQTDGLMRGFQLWINLPAAQKMSAPAYQEFSADAFPEIVSNAARIKLLCGSIGERSGPIEDPNTNIFYFDITIAAGESIDVKIPPTHQCFAYCYDGEASVVCGQGTQAIATHHLATLTEGDNLRLSAPAEQAKLILVGGQPIKEQIVQYGPFVMNSRAEIERALRDFQAGTLVREKAAFHTDH